MSSPHRSLPLRMCAVFTAALLIPSCGGEGSPVDPNIPLPPETILVAGNIATCGTTNDEATATLLESLPGTVFTLGDNAFPDGSAEAYRNCYEPSWGRHKARTYAALGNHEYNLGTAAASFDYFGDRAGPRDRGYYSFDLGNWHVIVLNVSDAVAFEEGSLQDQWLQADLAANSKTCTVALWHSPRFFSSNTVGYTSNAFITKLWERLYDAGVDLVLNGHQHHYERFPPMTPTGNPDQQRGIRQFNAGTGGESAEMPVAIAQHSEVRSDAFGVLRLILDAGSYSWEFVPAVAGQFTDSGTGTCH
ncbi:MAG TPA: metallophosphoesterase [Gemmatimonadales bacterium]|nr:metallophosphoesterase [Gemmatimonadales bacterium]